MHSSRMRTARLLPVSPSMHCSQGLYLPSGVYLPGGVPARRGCTCQGVYLPGGVYLPRGVPARWGTCLGGTCPGGTCLGDVPTQGVYLPRGYLPGGVPARGCTCQRGVYLLEGGTCQGVPAQLLPPPPRTEFLTHTTENITLAQTSSAGGNYCHSNHCCTVLFALGDPRIGLGGG